MYLFQIIGAYDLFIPPRYVSLKHIEVSNWRYETYETLLANVFIKVTTF